jgi:DNA-directed RNA polymerase specialized sigma24 family protein
MAVAALKTGCRNLIEDLFLSEPRLSYKDVSEKRGMPPGSIGPTLARCLETLRREWKSVSKGA